MRIEHIKRSTVCEYVTCIGCKNAEIIIYSQLCDFLWGKNTYHLRSISTT